MSDALLRYYESEFKYDKIAQPITPPAAVYPAAVPTAGRGTEVEPESQDRGAGQGRQEVAQPQVAQH